jgi:hypothetical protein
MKKKSLKQGVAMKLFIILMATVGLLLLPIAGFSDFIYTTAAAAITLRDFLC